MHDLSYARKPYRRKITSKESCFFFIFALATVCFFATLKVGWRNEFNDIAKVDVTQPKAEFHIIVLDSLHKLKTICPLLLDEYPKGKLGYGFLLSDRMSFHALWREYFNKARNGSWSASVHMSNARLCDGCPAIPFPHRTVSTMPTAWCKLVSMMVHVIRDLLMDPDVYGVTLISNAHLPLKAPDYVHSKLGNSNHSIFKSWKTKCSHDYCKSEMWFYLVRRDAEALVRDWDKGWGQELNRMLIENPYGNDIYALTKVGCPDEKYIVYTANKTSAHDMEFSDVPIWLTWDPRRDLSRGEYDSNCCREHPAEFRDLEFSTYVQMRRSCSLFARKASLKSHVVIYSIYGRHMIRLDEMLRNEMLGARYPYDSSYWDTIQHPDRLVDEPLVLYSQLPKTPTYPDPPHPSPLPSALNVTNHGWVPKSGNLVFAVLSDHQLSSLLNWTSTHANPNPPPWSSPPPPTTPREELNFDIFVVYIGYDQVELKTYRQWCRWVVWIPGGKEFVSLGSSNGLGSRRLSDVMGATNGTFAMFYEAVFHAYPEVMRSSEKIFFLDRNIRFPDPQAINTMFSLSKSFSLEISMPSLIDPHNKQTISWEITRHNTHKDVVLSYTSFVEMRSTLMSRQAVLRLMSVYNKQLGEWGVDYLMIWASGDHRKRSYGVVHVVQALIDGDGGRRFRYAFDKRSKRNVNVDEILWKFWAEHVGCPYKLPHIEHARVYLTEPPPHSKSDIHPSQTLTLPISNYPPHPFQTISRENITRASGVIDVEKDIYGAGKDRQPRTVKIRPEAVPPATVVDKQVPSLPSVPSNSVTEATVLDPHTPTAHSILVTGASAEALDAGHQSPVLDPVALGQTPVVSLQAESQVPAAAEVQIPPVAIERGDEQVDQESKSSDPASRGVGEAHRVAEPKVRAQAEVGNNGPDVISATSPGNPLNVHLVSGPQPQEETPGEEGSPKDLSLDGAGQGVKETDPSIKKGNPSVIARSRQAK
ncbi:hypothetical protein AAMO2058_000375800 [Amorphochlora amoebiformis]